MHSLDFFSRVFTYLVPRRCPRALACLSLSLLLLATCLLWQPGKRAHAFGRLMIQAPEGGSFNLPAAKVGVTYEYKFKTEGGFAPLQWSLVEGMKVPGVRLTEEGKLEGTPTEARREGFEFVVEVADSSTPPLRFRLKCRLFVQAAPLKIITSSTSALLIVTTENKSVEPAGNVLVKQPPDRLSADRSNRVLLPVVGDLSASLPSITASVGSAPLTSPPVRTSSNSMAVATVERAICGRLRPASLDHILPIIPTLPSVKALIDESSNHEIARLWRTITRESKYKDGQCTENPSYVVGQQRRATVLLLEWLRTQLRKSGEKNNDCADDGKGGYVSKKIQAKDPSKTNLQLNEIALGKCDKDTFDTKYGNLTVEILERQILLLNAYIGNVNVTVEEDGKAIVSTVTDLDGNYSTKFDFDSSKKYAVTSEADHRQSSRNVVPKEDVKQKLDLAIEDRPVNLLSRAVVGYQQAGAAATNFEQNYFFDLFVSQSLPFQQRLNPDFGEDWRIWGAVRAISVPQSGDITISGLANNFVTKVGELKVKDAARVFDYLAGLEYRVGGNYSLLPSFDRETKQKFSFSLIASFGFVTPTNPLETEPVVYRIPERLLNEAKSNPNSDLAKALAGKNYLAFVPDDRDRFFRQYYGGVRLQTFYFNRHNVPIQRFPAQLDITFGQNEYVAGGELKGKVFRLDGYFPLPYDKLNFINLFGTAVFKPGRVNLSTPLVLERVYSDMEKKNPIPATDTGVGLLRAAQFNRDYYRVGVGIDFVSFVQKLLGK